MPSLYLPVRYGMGLEYNAFLEPKLVLCAPRFNVSDVWFTFPSLRGLFKDACFLILGATGLMFLPPLRLIGVVECEHVSKH